MEIEWKLLNFNHIGRIIVLTSKTSLILLIKNLIKWWENAIAHTKIEKLKLFYSLKCDNTIMVGVNDFQDGSKYLTKFAEYSNVTSVSILQDIESH